MEPFRDYLTLAEAARELGLSKSRVEQFVRTGRLAVAASVGKVRLVRRTDVATLKATPRPSGRPPNSAG